MLRVLSRHSWRSSVDSGFYEGFIIATCSGKRHNQGELSWTRSIRRLDRSGLQPCLVEPLTRHKLGVCLLAEAQEHSRASISDAAGRKAHALCYHSASPLFSRRMVKLLLICFLLLVQLLSVAGAVPILGLADAWKGCWRQWRPLWAFL